jgi:hypothetical protein
VNVVRFGTIVFVMGVKMVDEPNGDVATRIAVLEKQLDFIREDFVDNRKSIDEKLSALNERYVSKTALSAAGAAFGIPALLILGWNGQFMWSGAPELVKKEAVQYLESKVQEIAPPIIEKVIADKVPSLTEEEVKKRIAPIAESNIKQMAPRIIEDDIKARISPIAEAKIKEIAPDIIEKDIQGRVSPIVDAHLKQVAPEMIEEEIKTRIPSLVERKIEEAIPEQISKAFPAQLDKLLPDIKRQVHADIENAVEQEFKSVFGSKYKSNLQLISDAAKHFSVDSGYFLCGPRDRPSPTQSDWEKTLVEKTIKFRIPFTSKPFVLLSLNSIDAETLPGITRLWVSADEDDITNTDFVFRLRAQVRDLHNCKVHWLAIDRSLSRREASRR